MGLACTIRGRPCRFTRHSNAAEEASAIAKESSLWSPVMAESLATAASQATQGTAREEAVPAPQATGSLDLEFASTLEEVEVALAKAPRHVRIRGEQWAQRLQLMAKVRQPLFQKDRNLHADLLLKCIQEGTWTEPLDKHPPEGPLPCLPRHVACTLRRARAERIARGRMEAPPPRDAGNLALEGSLATTASAAVRRSEADAVGAGTLRVSVAAPPAYAALAARVAHLESQNKQLRRQLTEARKRSERSASPLATRSVVARPRTPRTPRAAFAAPHLAVPAPPAEPAATERLVPVAVAVAGNPAPGARAPGPAADLHFQAQSRQWEPRSCPQLEVMSAVAGHASAPGPPPPEGDTEAFLRYLDAFQSYAGSLFAPTRPDP